MEPLKNPSFLESINLYGATLHLPCCFRYKHRSTVSLQSTLCCLAGVDMLLLMFLSLEPHAILLRSETMQYAHFDPGNFKIFAKRKAVELHLLRQFLNPALLLMSSPLHLFPNEVFSLCIPSNCCIAKSPIYSWLC